MFTNGHVKTWTQAAGFESRNSTPRGHREARQGVVCEGQWQGPGFSTEGTLNQACTLQS